MENKDSAGKEKRAAYMREWRAKNQEKSRTIAKKCYETNKEKAQVRSRKYYQLNKETIQETRVDYIKEWNENNREKINENKRRRYHKNPAKFCLDRRKLAIRTKYGLTLEEYNSKFESQHGLCSICGGDALALDHCHLTGKVRDFLCNRCNLTLGNINDNVEILNKMISYLQKWQEVSNGTINN
jgi:hypothetical protein